MNIYESIATRTNGNIYIGVVGPVRTGKSTFITRFMDKLVLPNVAKGYNYNRIVDELPQSGDGNQIMTMEPRFVPNEAISVKLGNVTDAKIRLVDCVGYLIDGVSGHIGENGNPRMVNTPWNSEPIPFSQASEIGTEKVINEHSTIGIVVTTDGTITNLPRENYQKAEERVIQELKDLNKPFVVLLNTKTPQSEQTQNLARAMGEQYDVKVVVKNILEMEEEDFREVLKEVLYEFPVKKVVYNLPTWLNCLPIDNEMIVKIIDGIKTVDISKMNEAGLTENLFIEERDVSTPKLNKIDVEHGEILYDINTSENLYYKAIQEISKEQITNEYELLNYIKLTQTAKENFDKLQTALVQAENDGYGIVIPNEDELILEDPEIINKSGVNNLKLKANAPCLHIMKVNVSTEVTPPNVGGFNPEIELKDGEENDIWNTSVFGKKLSNIAYETIVNKLSTFPSEAETKLVKTVTKITNENRGGIICILL